jgi:hypothetical protein
MEALQSQVVGAGTLVIVFTILILVVILPTNVFLMIIAMSLEVMI